MQTAGQFSCRQGQVVADRTRDLDISTLKTIARVKKLEERLEDKIACMESLSSPRRLINKLAKATTKLSYLASEL